MVTREQIEAAYAMLLGRQPGEQELNNWLARRVEDVNRLRYEFINSNEFTQELERLRPRQVSTPSNESVGRPFKPLPLEASRLVFVHLPKCGGTSLHGLLKLWYGEEALHPERFNGLYSYRAAQNASSLIFSGHYDFYSTSLIPGRKYYITVMREPIARLVSLYNFYRAHTPEYAATLDDDVMRAAQGLLIDDFFDSPLVRSAASVDNAMTRQLSDVPQPPIAFVDQSFTKLAMSDLLEQACKNLESFGFVAFTETLDQDLVRLMALLGMQADGPFPREQVLEDVMVNSEIMRKVARQQPSPETVKAMEPLVAYDRLLIAKAKARFVGPA